MDLREYFANRKNEGGGDFIVTSEQLGEPFFQIYGPTLGAKGWSIYPQERTGRRMPARIEGEVVAWSKYQEERPSAALLEKWALHAATANVAVVMGPSSANAIALDIDVTDELLSASIEHLALRIFGHTDYRRIGNAPKIMMFYRLAETASFNKRTLRLAMPDDETVASEHMIEILAKASTVTFYGRHHSTGARFQWLEPPVYISPDQLPVITEDMLNEFEDALSELRPIFNPVSQHFTLDVSSLPTSSGEKRIAIPSNHTDWKEDPKTGLISDGREKYLTRICFELIRANPSKSYSREDYDQLARIAFDVFTSKAERTGRWNDGFLLKEINTRLQRNGREMEAGRITPNTRLGHRGPAYDRSVAERLEQDRAVVKAGGEPAKGRSPVRIPVTRLKAPALMMDFLPSANGRKGVDDVLYSPVDLDKARERMLEPDRTEIARKVQDTLQAALDDVFAEIYRERSEYDTPRIDVVKAPTGSGKTSKTINYIANDPRTKQWDDADASVKKPGPILFMLPTYNNIQELRDRAEVLNLDPNLSDEELERAAADRGLTPVGNFDERVANLRRDASDAGIRTMIYKGKEAAGCKMQSKLKLLQQAGVGSSGLCKAEVGKGEEKETKFCMYYQECPAIQQKAAIRAHHVVFIPHAFLTLQIPEELKDVRAVIADESIFQLFVHTANLSLLTLKQSRGSARLTKAQKETGLNAETIAADRDTAASIAAEALVAGQDPALALHRYIDKTPQGHPITGMQLVASAKQICGDNMSMSSQVTPEVTEEDLKALVSKPTGVEIAQEYRFWKIIEERLEILKHDALNRDLVASINRRIAAEEFGVGEDVSKVPRERLHRFSPTAKGNRDYRIQLLSVPDHELTERQLAQASNLGMTLRRATRQIIRMSWRETANWSDKPLVLLDASASPKIITKIFGGRVIKTHDIPAPLNVRTIAVLDRTYSNSALVAKHGNKDSQEKAASLLTQAQNLISMVSGLFGYGRVVVGTSVAVRRALAGAWDAPDNVDFTHFGAMRGLDFAKNHAAAVSFGRMEPPVNAIDALVAALSFDDDRPEEPIDVTGEAQLGSSKQPQVPTAEQVIPLRNGQDARIQVPTYSGAWAIELQKQYREEELRQFLGRLRPVYREGEAPVWFAGSKVLPDNVVVDEVVTLNDLLKSFRKSKAPRIWNSLRLTEGVLETELLFDAERTEKRKTPPMVAHEIRDYLRAPHVIDDGYIPHRTMWGFRPARVLFRSGPREGREVDCFIRTSVADPASTVRDVYDKIQEVDAELVHLGEPLHAPLIGRKRDRDWVDSQIGTRNDRIRSEYNAIADMEQAVVVNLLPTDLGKPDPDLDIISPNILRPLIAPAKRAAASKADQVKSDGEDKSKRAGTGRTLTEVKNAFTTSMAISKMTSAEIWLDEPELIVPDHTGEWQPPEIPAPPAIEKPVREARPAPEPKPSIDREALNYAAMSLPAMPEDEPVYTFDPEQVDEDSYAE